MAKKNARNTRGPKKVAKKSLGKSGRGSARMSGRKPKGQVKSSGKKGAASALSVASEVQRALALVNWSHELTAKLINSIPSDRMTFQSSPSDNHALWTIGHLATAYAWVAGMIDGRTSELPASYESLFGFRSKPVGDASAYPKIEEIRTHHEAAFRRLCDAIAAMSDAEAHLPPKSDSGGSASSRIEAVYKGVWHEGWHQGQVSALRRAMGLPPLF